MNQAIHSTKVMLYYAIFKNAWLIFLIPVLFSCSDPGRDFTENENGPIIFPDYTNITIPPNIAPINFTIKDRGDKYAVKLHSSSGDVINISSVRGDIQIPSEKWRRLLDKSKGNELFIDIYIKRDKRWFKFQPVVNLIADEPIDSYLVYRLFDQGYLVWNKMGIYQRCLENFNETPVMLNSMSGRNCMNCHSFSRNSSKTMLFHMRGNFPGTIIYKDGKIKRVNTKTSKTISPGVYPSWNPDGRYVAFSVNHISNAFYSLPEHRREAIDSLSDLIIYDTERNKISNCEAIASRDRLETFPSWSPDGHYLYFISAVALPPDKYRLLRYDLLRIAFDPAAGQFGAVDTVISSSRTGLSISFPRISPDGRYLLFCMTAYGNFTIWHKDSDLYLMDLSTNEITKPDINSDEAESYHSWSSDGRWIVFSSRRTDGLFTRLFIAYFDKHGKAYKPFLLPQKDPGFYDTFLKTYNVPELVTSEVKLNPRILSEAARSVPVNTTFESDK